MLGIPEERESSEREELANGQPALPGQRTARDAFVISSQQNRMYPQRTNTVKSASQIALP